MMEILPDIIRAIVTDVMLVLLLHTISTPRYESKWPYLITTFVIVIVNLSINIYFYEQGDYSSVVVVDFVMLLICASLKMLFKERLTHWIFGFVTVLNVYAIIVFISWIFADFFPFPFYANTVLRLLLFGGFIFALRRWILPVYRQVMERWNIYILLLVVFFINMLYYFLYGDDLEGTLTLGQWPLFLLIALGICTYIAVFYSMKSTLREYELLEENQIMQTQDTLLQHELTLYNEFVIQAKQHRHDLRHHNALLMEYLSHEDLEGAKKYLSQYDQELKNTAMIDYCKNPVANAVLRRVAARARESGIEFTTRVDIPEDISLTQPEVGVLFSNLLENACEACEKCNSPSPFLLLTVKIEEEHLKLQMHNSVDNQVLFDEFGMPQTTKVGGGTGTKSIERIVKKYDGMLNFKQNKNTFITQIILPLNNQ